MLCELFWWVGSMCLPLSVNSSPPDLAALFHCLSGRCPTCGLPAFPDIALATRSQSWAYSLGSSRASSALFQRDKWVVSQTQWWQASGRSAGLQMQTGVVILTISTLSGLYQVWCSLLEVEETNPCHSIIYWMYYLHSNNTKMFIPARPCLVDLYSGSALERKCNSGD